MKPKYKRLDFPHFIDERGTLTPFEFDDSFPFLVKRVYLVTARDQAVRGGHAHKIETELFVAARGSIKALVNDGEQDQTIELDTPGKALLVEPGCWHEFTDFSPEAVMLCFSSTPYLPGEANYITDKNAFLKTVHVAPELTSPTGWHLENGHLTRTITLRNFVAAVALINQIKDLAEAANHHPDITLHDYKNLRISMLTHDKGMITERDIKLAEQINTLTEPA